MSRLVVCLVAASVLIAWASAACNPAVAWELDSGDCRCNDLSLVYDYREDVCKACNPAVAWELDSGDCRCNDSSLVYDYRENVCKDESILYCTAGLGPFGNLTGCYTGFTNITGQCEDVDECALGTNPCLDKKVCYNIPGNYHCGCRDKFYSTDGGCVNIDESLNPLWNDCPQLVSDRTPGYKCRCFDAAMFNDTLGNGMACELNPGYTNCSKDSDKGVMCVEELATGQQSFFPMLGFQLNVNNAFEDKDECLNSEETLCWDNADCENLVNRGGYECTCRPGYTDNIFLGVVKECILRKCNKGEGLDCVHVCDDFSECRQDEYCVLLNDLPTCTPRLADVICDKQSSKHKLFKLFNNTIVIFDPEESPGLVTQSLEMVFGAGNVQLLGTGSPSFTLHVLLNLNMTQEGAKERLGSHCDVLSQLPGYCELPGCVIIEQVTTEFILDEAECAECSEDTHYYDSDTRTCKCKDGGTRMYFEDILEICDPASSQTTTVEASSTEQLPSTTEETNWRDVATDLQRQLDDAEDAVKITGAVLGTLLGLSLVGIAVLVFFKKGAFFSS